MKDENPSDELSGEESSSFIPKGSPTAGQRGFEPSRRAASSVHLSVLYAINAALLITLAVLTLRWPSSVDEYFYCEFSGFETPGQVAEQNPAPAHAVAKWENNVFLDNVYEISEYQGEPNDEKDRLWDMLYRGEFGAYVHGLRLTIMFRHGHHGCIWRRSSQTSKRHNGFTSPSLKTRSPKF